jgi:hypothetical protein
MGRTRHGDDTRAARWLVPRSSHGSWEPAADRRDPMTLLEEQDATRAPSLCPWATPACECRRSPSTAARPASWPPTSHPRPPATARAARRRCPPVQLRFLRLPNESPSVFDANDFDETLPGPREWDVKRLAASYAVAGQHLDLNGTAVRRATATVVRAYHKAMEEYAPMEYLVLWYDRFTIEDLHAASHMSAGEMAGRVKRFSSKARKRTGSVEVEATTTNQVEFCARPRGRILAPATRPVR